MKKHRYREKVYVKSPHIQSRASYVKLKRYLTKKDPTENWEKNVGFRQKFLLQKLEEHGKLCCEYCGRDDLILDPFYPHQHIRKTRTATIDHVKPKCKGGSWYDPDNIKISCPQCNTAKADLSLLEFEATVERAS